MLKSILSFQKTQRLPLYKRGIPKNRDRREIMTSTSGRQILLKKLPIEFSTARTKHSEGTKIWKIIRFPRTFNTSDLRLGQTFIVRTQWSITSFDVIACVCRRTFCKAPPIVRPGCAIICVDRLSSGTIYFTRLFRTNFPCTMCALVVVKRRTINGERVANVFVAYRESSCTIPLLPSREYHNITQDHYSGIIIIIITR